MMLAFLWPSSRSLLQYFTDVGNTTAYQSNRRD